MYGIIHQAARQMVIEVASVEVWEKILIKSGLGSNYFDMATKYDDAVTFKLIGEIQTQTGMPVDELLEAFGRYWIRYSENSSYGSIMKMAGNNLVSVLNNLDRMHTSLKSRLPDAQMPYFEVIEADDDHIQVMYRSYRDGLEIFVKGLLLGLMDKFSDKGEITFEEEGDGILYRIDLQPALESVC